MVYEAGLFVGIGLLLLLAVSLSPGLCEEWGRLTVLMFLMFANVFDDYIGSASDMRNPSLEFEGHVESTKSHLSTFIAPHCPLPLLFFEQHFFRIRALWRGRLYKKTLGTTFPISIPFSSRIGVTFRPVFTWWEEKLKVPVRGGSSRGDVGIIWTVVAVARRSI